MKRGGVRTKKKYVEHDGEKYILWEIQGRKGKTWIPVVEKNPETKKNEPMIYSTREEAEKKLKEIVKSMRRGA